MRRGTRLPFRKKNYFLTLSSPFLITYNATRNNTGWLSYRFVPASFTILYIFTGYSRGELETLKETIIHSM